MNNEKVALALSSGGARGLAHIGALRAIEEAGLTPVAVAGSSMGAIVGAMVAGGYGADRIAGVFTDRSRFKLPIPGRRGGLIGHETIIDAFCSELPERIEALELPFAAVAVDISKGETVVLKHGSLRPALAASVAVPGILKPVEIDGRHLVDGGVINTLPVDVVREMSDAPVLAVDVTPERDRTLAFERSTPWWRRAWERMIFRRRPLAVDVFLKAFEIQQSLLKVENLQRYTPDIFVDVDLDPGVRIEDFHRYREVIEAGYRSTMTVLRSR